MSSLCATAVGLHLPCSFCLLLESAVFLFLFGFGICIRIALLSLGCQYLLVNRVEHGVTLLAHTDTRLLISRVCDDAYIIESGDTLHMAQPYFLAVSGGFCRALITHTFLAIFWVVRESERHSADITTTNKFQSVICAVSMRKVAAGLYMRSTILKRQCALAIFTPSQHISHHCGVIDIKNHVTSLQ